MLYQYQMQRRRIGIKQEGIKSEGGYPPYPLYPLYLLYPLHLLYLLYLIYLIYLLYPYPLKNKRKNNEHKETNNSTCHVSSGNIM